MDFLRMVCMCVLITGVSALEQQASRTARSPNPYKYKIDYFNVSIDHFGFANKDKYGMRFLYNTDNWDSNGGTILFYCGNEGDIENFAANTGFMWDISKELKAMVLFAEHRYYGKSLPYGNASFQDAAHLGYLTSEQALADYAVFLTWIRKEMKGAQHSPIVAFGGSYGGMLASWMRAKYPQIIIGALAASAPVLQFEGVTPCETYDEIVTKTFGRYGDTCVENIRKSWQAMTQLFNSGAAGQAYLKQTFNLCKDIKTASDLSALKGWIKGAWGNVVMVEYPYPANFIQNLPAWPVKEVCAPLQKPYWNDPKQHMHQLSLAAQAYFNYSNSFVGSCFDTTAEPDNLGADSGWNFQACSEMIMPMCDDGKRDFFEPSTWNLDTVVAQCAKTYGITPRPYWVMTNYLGVNVSGASNIIFSYKITADQISLGRLSDIGDRDAPERSGAARSPMSESLPRLRPDTTSYPLQNITSIIIANGAHHLDLRASNPADPADVVLARKAELSIIKQWISDYRQTDRQQSKN